MLNVPAQESVYTTKYTDFKGVDFTSQVCSMKRFPKAKNFIISDMVEKRPGYKTLKQFEGKINGLFSTIIEDVHYFIIHAGENLYAVSDFNEEPTLLLSGINNSKSSGFYSNGYYYILTGKEYIRTDGKTANAINEENYNRPFEIESYISLKDGKTELTDLKKEDLLKCRKTGFSECPVTYKTDMSFWWCQEATANRFKVSYYGSMAGFEKVANTNINLLNGVGCVEYKNFQPAVFTYYSSNYTICGYTLPPDWRKSSSEDGGNKVFIEYEDGTIEGTLVTSEWMGGETSDVKEKVGVVQIPVSTLNKNKTGQSFKIYYQTGSFTDQKLYQCTETTFIQYGNGMYHFFTGNSNEPNKDWQSELNNPTYFPSDNYSIYGTEDEILGYGQYGEYVAIFKKGGNDNNIYIKSVQDIDGLGVTFPTSVGVGGAIGGVSSHTIKNLNGETLYLTREGIYALTSLSTTNMKITRNRSFFVDGRLLKEENLENAIATVWKNKYVLCINSHCYILDGGQPLAYREGSNNDYVYECLYWDNIPATSLLTKDNELYFGTEDGRICVFTDGIYTDDGSNIDTMIATVLDDDGNYMALKKMKKKGTGLLVKPYVKSSFDISFLYDNFENTYVKTAYADIFDFDDMDFERVTFETSSNPRIIPFLKKSKKYKAIQIVLRSNNNEPFGFMSIIKRYTFNNYVKRS